MIELLLPAGIVTVEALDDNIPADLFPDEAALVRDAVDKRRNEFATARRCARQALSALGCESAPILAGPKREPIWPRGFIGSITHCDGYRAAAVARSAEFASVGIDAEPHAPLPDGVLNAITIGNERALLAIAHRDRPTVHWDRLLFSAKESVYKAWYPLTGLWLGFEEAHVELASDGTFHADLLISQTVRGADRTPAGFDGRWLAGCGLVLTAVTVTLPEYSPEYGNPAAARPGGTTTNSAL